ncbi:superoxide dismutase, partial [bacterium]|nr:superoxide dismutase [bacterium]
YIDAQTLELHYTKHHRAYVDGLNKAEEGIEEARKTKDFSKIKALKKELAFHGSGHVLHSIYWTNLCPPQGRKTEPSGKLMESIIRDFGSYEIFVSEFKSASAVVEGSGWGILVSIEGRLEILTIEKHQDLWQMGAIPILVCDVWEHAYYLKYQNKRPAYIDGFFNLINWENVEERYEKTL